jgi:dihydroorotate dehydrogenase
VAILCERIEADVANPGGVHMAEDVSKSRVDGAKAARMTAALRKNGVPPPKAMRADIEARMEKYACPSIHRR